MEGSHGWSACKLFEDIILSAEKLKVFYLAKNNKQVVEKYETLILTNAWFFSSTAQYKLL